MNHIKILLVMAILLIIPTMEAVYGIEDISGASVRVNEPFSVEEPITVWAFITTVISIVLPLVYRMLNNQQKLTFSHYRNEIVYPKADTTIGLIVETKDLLKNIETGDSTKIKANLDSILKNTRDLASTT